MCGIAGRIGSDAGEFVVDALKKLEYRGYDSYGILGLDNANWLHIHKKVGRITKGDPGLGVTPVLKLAMGHTRWATHGEVSRRNAHPVGGPNCYVVANGIVEKESQFHCSYHSDTDSEFIARLFEHYLVTDSFPEAICKTQIRLNGNFSCLIWHRGYPDKLIAMCKGKCLYYGDNYVTSDPYALSGYTELYSILQDGWMAFPLSPAEGTHYVPDVPDSPCKYPHHMLAEIYEQPRILREMEPTNVAIENDRVTLFGCGSSYYAALLGRKYFQVNDEYDVSVEYASQLYTDETWGDQTFIALTQSGETHDTLQAMDELSRSDCQIICLTNNEHSQAARLAHEVIPLGCGPEVGVAATKTFTAQAVRLLDMAGYYLDGLAKNVEDLLTNSYVGAIKEVTSVVSRYEHVYYFGSDFLYPIAKEGALKLKEVSYIHAEATLSSELKHGPIALIDDKTLSCFLLSPGPSLVRTLNNMSEVQARKGKIVAFCPKSLQEEVSKRADHVAVVPDALPLHLPIVINVALQLVAYYAAVEKGLDPDKPRNLAKSVTV